MCRRAHTCHCSWYDGRCDDHRTAAMATDEAEYAGAAADVVEGRQADMLFWFDEAVFEDSTLLLGDEGKDHHHLYAATATASSARCLQVEGTFPMEESARISPRDQNHDRSVDDEAEPMQQVQVEVEAKGIAVDVPTKTAVLESEQRSAPAPAVVAVPPENNVSIQGNQSHSVSASCYSDLYSFHL